jgi:hypothetical protein
MWISAIAHCQSDARVLPYGVEIVGKRELAVKSCPVVTPRDRVPPRPALTAWHVLRRHGASGTQRIGMYMRRTLAVRSGAALFITTLACSAATDPATSVTRVKVDQSAICLLVGETTQLQGTAVDQTEAVVSGVTFDWRSSDTTLAAVDERGW